MCGGLSEIHDHLTAIELKPGFMFRGERIPLINPQRGTFKPEQMRFLLSITADPLPEGYLDRRLLRGAGRTARQGCCRVVGIRHRPPEDGWLEEHTAWQKRDLSAKRYVYIRADGIHLQARLEDDSDIGTKADEAHLDR
jgi:hypothetical protein